MGLVEQFSGSYDKRVQNTVLTRRGDEIVEKIEELLLHTNNLIMEQIDLEGQENVYDVLEKLVWAIDCVREK